MTDEDDLAPRAPRPESWDQVFAITGELKNVSIELIERGRPDWRYNFSSKDMRACGRKGCEKMHADGWLVAIGGRRFVNIGNCCARKYANVDLWDKGLRAYSDRQRTDARNAVIVTARHDAQQKQYWLDNNPELAVAIALHDSFLSAAQGPLLREVEKRAEKSNTRIERDVRLTEAEREARLAMASAGLAKGEPTPYVAAIERVHVGDITGLQCFRPLRDPRSLRLRLQNLVDTLLKWSPAANETNANRSLVQATQDLVPFSNDLNESIVATQRFYSDANMRALLKLDVARAQGILAIEREGQDNVRIVRKPHWGKAA